MGMMFTVSCDACGYRAERMVSGYDRGMMAHVVGTTCAECRELHVVRLPGNPWEPPPELAFQNQAPSLPAGVVCPANPDHHLTPWHAPGPCPRCEAVMGRMEEMIMWD